MLYELIKIFSLSFIPACFSYFLDYCFGFPQGEQINQNAVLFSWTYGLAKRRLRKENKLRPLLITFQDLLSSDNADTRKQGIKQLELSTVVTAKDLFGWENVFGMCKFCTNFWLCIIAAAIMFFNVHLHFFSNYFFFLFIPIFSHTILRKI